MVVIYVMRENIKYEGTHTCIARKAEIFDQYGLIIIHQQKRQEKERKRYKKGKETMEKAKGERTIG